MHADSDREHAGHSPAHHVTGLPVYFGIFIALLVFTVMTVAVSRVDLGMLNTPIAMGIAVVKATLVVLFFMHVIHSSRLTWVVILGALLWLGVLFVLTLADYLTRHWVIY